MSLEMGSLLMTDAETVAWSGRMGWGWKRRVEFVPLFPSITATRPERRRGQQRSAIGAGSRLSACKGIELLGRKTGISLCGVGLGNVG
jgi:hypothetical protein